MASPALIDAHMHLWDPFTTPRRVSPLVRAFRGRTEVASWVAERIFPRDAIDFVGDGRYVLDRYMPEHYAADASRSGIEKFVHVQAGWHKRDPMASVDETRWLMALEFPSSGPRLAGIVAHADLSLGADVRPVLEAHQSASPLVRGIRDMLSWHPSPGVMDYASPGRSLTVGFRRGFEELARAGLSYDAWCYHHQLPEVESLARAHPEVPIALCHFGSPVGIGGAYAGQGETREERARIRAEWQLAFERLSECPNVFVKLSGLGMPLNGFGFHERSSTPTRDEVLDAFGPLWQRALECVGPQRCMFGSNYPIDKVSVPLATLSDALMMFVDNLDPQERARVLGGTAREFYRL